MFIEKLIEYFNLDLVQKNDGTYVGICPIHHSADNETAFNLHQNNSWKCWTHSCHEIFKPANIFGLCRGLLSKYKGEWVQKGDRIYDYEQTVKFIQSFDNTRKKLDSDFKDTYKFIKKRKQETKLQNTNILNLIKKTIIPSEYYLGRSYKASTLIKYQVGDFMDASDVALYGRAMVPISHCGTIVGYTARSHANQCNYCKGYHLLGCGDKKYSKWYHGPGLKTSQILYNLDFARQYIGDSCILVEGPGDIWRLEESGIYNGLALLGKELSPSQRQILFKLSLKKIILALDSDEAGQEASQKISGVLNQFVNIKVIKLPNKDIGEMDILETKKLFTGVING